MRILIPLLVVVSLCAAQDPAKQTKQPYVPKNLQVLKIEPSEIRPTMAAFAAGLAVQCGFCHVGRDMASDENPKKAIARHMITMVSEINAKFPDGKVHVTCYTCHRGETEPKMAPEPKPAAQ